MGPQTLCAGRAERVANGLKEKEVIALFFVAQEEPSVRERPVLFRAVRDALLYDVLRGATAELFAPAFASLRREGLLTPEYGASPDGLAVAWRLLLEGRAPSEEWIARAFRELDGREAAFLRPELRAQGATAREAFRYLAGTRGADLLEALATRGDGWEPTCPCCQHAREVGEGSPADDLNGVPLRLPCLVCRTVGCDGVGPCARGASAARAEREADGAGFRKDPPDGPGLSRADAARLPDRNVEWHDVFRGGFPVEDRGTCWVARTPNGPAVVFWSSRSAAEAQRFLRGAALATAEADRKATAVPPQEEAPRGPSPGSRAGKRKVRP